jgi:hypothetical protein
MNLEESEILKIVEACELELKSSEQIKFSFDKKWTDNFPKKAGIYAIFYKDKLVYVGESANLKERMKEVKRTYNHSFRRKLGVFLNPNAKVTNGKFLPDLEELLNEHYRKYLKFTCKEVNFGRIEIENHLMQRNEGVLNSISKRGKING